jgi:type II secretory pathway pseudopilin PulG
MTVSIARGQSRPVPGSRSTAPGFTLIESALATVIVGVGVVAVMQLFAGLTQQNRLANRQTVALHLANNLQEITNSLAFASSAAATTFGPEAGESIRGGSGTTPFDDVDDFNGQVFSPPIDSLRQPVAALSQFRQRVTVTQVDPNKLTLAGANTDARRITVRVTFQVTPTAAEEDVYTVSWLRMR